MTPWMLAAALGVTSAPPCPVDDTVAGTVAQGRDLGERLAFLQGRLALGAKRARMWSAAWGTAYGALAVTLLAVTPAVDRGTRVDLYVGAASASVGVLTRAVLVPRVVREHRRVVRRSDRGCAAVRAAEQALVRSAKAERRGRSLLVHASALLYNVGVGLVLGLGFDRPVSAARQASIGAIIGQIMLVTQPMVSARTLEEYRRGALGAWFTPLVLPRGVGVGLAGRM